MSKVEPKQPQRIPFNVAEMQTNIPLPGLISDLKKALLLFAGSINLSEQGKIDPKRAKWLVFRVGDETYTVASLLNMTNHKKLSTITQYLTLAANNTDLTHSLTPKIGENKGYEKKGFSDNFQVVEVDLTPAYMAKAGTKEHPAAAAGASQHVASATPAKVGGSHKVSNTGNAAEEKPPKISYDENWLAKVVIEELGYKV